MKIFKDSKGRNWEIAINIGTVKRVRDLLSVNLIEIEAGEPPLLTRLGTDVIFLCDVIYCLVKGQADLKGITDEEFGSSLGGDSIIEAQKAFYEELTDFFRQCGRTDRIKAIAAQMKMIELSIAKIDQIITAVNPAGEVEKIFSKQSTSLQE